MPGLDAGGQQYKLTSRAEAFRSRSSPLRRSSRGPGKCQEGPRVCTLVSGLGWVCLAPVALAGVGMQERLRPDGEKGGVMYV